MPQIIPYQSSAGLALGGASQTLATSQQLQLQEEAGQRAQERHEALLERAELEKQRDEAAVQGAAWMSRYAGKDQVPTGDLMRGMMERLGPLGAGPGMGIGAAAIQAHGQKKLAQARQIMSQMGPEDAMRFAEALQAEAQEETREIQKGQVRQHLMDSIQDGVWGEDESGIGLVEGLIDALDSDQIDSEGATKALIQQKEKLVKEQTLKGLLQVNIKRGTEMASAFGKMSDRQEAAVMALNGFYEANYRTMRPEKYMEEMRRILLADDTQGQRARTEALSRAMSGLMELGILPGSPEFEQRMAAAATYFGNEGGSYPGGAGPRPRGTAPPGPRDGSPPPPPPSLTSEQIQGFAQMKRENVQSRDSDYGQRLSALGLTPFDVDQMNASDLKALDIEMSIKPEDRKAFEDEQKRKEGKAQKESESRVAYRGLSDKAKALKPRHVRKLKDFAGTLMHGPDGFRGFGGKTLEEFAREEFGISEEEARELMEHGTQHKQSPGEVLLEMLGLTSEQTNPHGVKRKPVKRRR